MSISHEHFRFATKDGTKLHGLHWHASPDAGEAPTILLHGGGANCHWWDHLAPKLALRGPVHALDFRGHGDSDHPTTREVGAFNLDLEAMVAWLGREDVHLVGHSLGAAVAFDHASRFPATRSIALIDLARGSERGTGRRARLALALRRTYATREEAIERFRFLPESSHPSDSLRIAIAEKSVREEADGRFGYKFDPGWFGLPSRPRPDPSDIACPTLLIRGAESRLLSAEAAETFARSVPKGRLVEIPDAGHHVLVDQPERLLAVLAAFREEISGD